MRTRTSYVLQTGAYAALRIPQLGKGPSGKRVRRHATVTSERLAQLEQEALRTVRAYARQKGCCAGSSWFRC